jgi:PAS domain S-box-containing protein
LAVSALIIILLIAIISVLSLRQVQKAESVTRHLVSTQNVLLHTQKTIAQAVHFNVYLKKNLFNDSRRLPVNYLQMRNEIFNKLTHLRKINGNEVIPHQRIDSVITLINKNLVLSAKIIGDKETDKVMDNGQRNYQEINTAFIDTFIGSMQNISNNMDECQEQLLEAQKKESDKEFYLLKITFYLSFLSILLILIFFITKTQIDLNLQRKTNEQLLYLAKMVENTNDAIFLTDKNLTILMWNKGAEKLYGYLSGETIGKNAVSIVRTDYQEGEKETILQCMQSGYWNGEARQLNKKEEPVYVYSTITAIKNKEGTITNYVAINRDITGKKRKQNEFINLANILNVANDAIYKTDKEFRITSWNEGAENVYGYTAEEAIGKQSTELLKMPSPLLDVNSFDFTKNTFIKKESAHFKKNGEKIITELSISYSVPDNCNGYFFIVVSDITEKKKNEDRINQLATIAESTNDAIYTTDKEDVITHWNKGAVRLYGFSTEEALNKKAFELLPAYTPLFKHKEAFKNEEVTYFKEETAHRKKNGKLIIVSISVTPLKDDNNTINGFIFVAHDMTEIKQLEGELKNLNEHLEIQVEEKTAEIKEIFERLTDGFVALDKNWNYTYANKKAEEILRKESGYLVGKSLWKEFPDRDQRFYKAYRKALETQQYVYFEDFYEPFNFWLENHIYPSPNGITIYMRDTTEQKKAQEDLVKLNYRFRSLSSHLQNSREEERIHIAREIHDELGQLTTALKLDMSWLRKKIAPENIEIKSKLDDTIILLDEMVKTIRRISQELRPSILDNLGLSAAIEWYLNDFGKRTNIKCKFDNGVGEEDDLPANIKTSLFRICQESLTNVMRHSKATEVRCTLSKSRNRIYLTIQDNGEGFDKNQKSKSFGLLGMQERAIMVNGELKIDSALGKGTTINVEIEL